MPEDQFQKINTKNEWAYLTYSLEDGTPLDEEAGGTAVIRWPDGDENTVRFSVESKNVSYGDHGHTYHTTQHRHVFIQMLNGKIVQFDLADFPVRKVMQP